MHNIKQWGIAISTLFALALAIIFIAPNTFATDSTGGDVLHSATLTYDGNTIDIYNNTYTISIDDQKDLVIDFDVDHSVKKLLLRDITEDGEAKNICGTGERQCSFNATQLIAGSGLEIVLYDWDDNVVRQTMLGLIIKQNATKEDYEVPVSIGPGTGIKIDMSSVSSGMSFSVNPIPIPVKYEHYSDGRSVIGIGFNSSDEKFWDDAAKDTFKERISKSDLYKKWEESQKHESTGGSLGLVWAIGGYAMSYDDNPEKMTGSIQVYIGSGYNVTGQYAIFTYSVTVTFGATGEFIFTIDPSSEQRFTGSFDLDLSTGLELYGGIGSGWLASIGIYGAAKIGAGMHILPEFDFYSLYVSGEIGMKAKVLGRDIMTFVFTSGTKEFIDNKTEEDGVITYTTDLSLKDVMVQERDKLIAGDYGNQPAGEVKTPVGDTKWNLTNLTTPTSDNSYDYAHRIAENVYEHSGTQVIKEHSNTLKAVTVFANNSGELNYSIFDGFNQQMSEPKPVAGEGQDFNARLVRGFYQDQSFLVWKRVQNNGSNNATLSEVEKSGEIMIARFDNDTETFVDSENVTTGTTEIYAGLGVTTTNRSGDTDPYVFAYTNPDSDPEGLSESTYHDILVFHKENGAWVKRKIGTFNGIITSFDAGVYNGTQSVAFTTKPSYGASTFTYVLDSSGNNLATFDWAWGAQFIINGEDPTLVFMKNDILYSSVSGGSMSKEFGDDDHTLPRAPFKVIGDLTGTFMISYLSSVDSRQNIVGFVKSNGECNYEPLVITNVDENSYVSYYAGAYTGNNFSPFIVYTVQNYENTDTEWVEGQADMYAISGESANHISILAADITNTKDLAVTTNTAEVDVLLKNTGLFNIKNFSIYLKNDGESNDEYVKLADYEIPMLRPGETYQLELELPEADYATPRSYVLGVTSRDKDYDNVGVQSEYAIEAAEGPIGLDDPIYNFHDHGNHDAYTVRVKSYGPGTKNGKVIFYNAIDKTVYKESTFENLAPGDIYSDTLENADSMLSSNYENLAVRVMSTDEAVDDNWPTSKFRKAELLPAWFKNYINKVGGTNADGIDIDVPDTGAFTRAATIATCVGGAALTIFCIATTSLWFIRRKR